MTGNDRQSQAAGADSKDVHDYKKRRAVPKAESHPLPPQLLGTFLIKRVLFITVATMVSMWFLAKFFVAFVPLTSVVAQYSNASVLPELLDATADELIAGLEAGQFTSLDLVQVILHSNQRIERDLLTCDRSMLNAFFKSTRPCTWSLRSTRMPGRLRLSSTRSVRAERFAGELHQSLS